MANEAQPKIVLIDDDQNYCTIMTRIADAENIYLEAFTSLGEMGSIGRLLDYDVALVDYDLGSMNGVEVGEYLSLLFKDKPMVLVSGKKRQELAGKKWPASIKAFVNKTDGYRQVLRKALLHSNTGYMIQSSQQFGEKL